MLAAVVRLIDLTHARVGNDEYARTNKSYGLTTLENRHAEVTGSHLRLHFRGKSGKTHSLDVRDPQLSRIVRQCEELPGQRLFEYQDEQGKVHRVGSHDVNEYIRRHASRQFSAKDFRTLAGTVLAARALREQKPCSSKAQLKRAVNEVLEFVSSRLGNTIAVCRKSYVHPAVFSAYEHSLLGRGSSSRMREERLVFRSRAHGGRKNHNPEGIMSIDKREHLISILKDFDVAMLVTKTDTGYLRSRPMGLASVTDDGVVLLSANVTSDKVAQIQVNPQVALTAQGKGKFAFALRQGRHQPR